MTVKQLHIALKQGKTTQEIVEKFNFSSEEEFLAFLKKIANFKYDEFVRQLRRNDKRAMRLDNGSEYTPIETETAHEAPVEFDVSTDIETSTETIEQETNMETPQVTRVSQLEILKGEEQEFSDILCSLEGQHKALVCERKRIADGLQETKSELEKLLQKVAQYEEEVTTKWEQYSLLAAQMQKLDGEMNAYRSALNDIREAMEKLRQVVILVTPDNIEVENEVLPQVSPEEVSDNFAELLTHEEAEELKVREIKTLAQLLVVVKHYERYEMLFENSKMEALFEKFKVAA